MSASSLALIALLSAGCSTVERPVQLQPVDSRLLLRVQEELTPSGRTLWLYLATERQYGCANYEIGYRTSRGPGIGITITGVKAPRVCAEAIGPATARINLGVQTGTVPMRITVNGAGVDGQLIASSESYELTGLVGSWTDVTRPVVLRVPLHALWGFVAYYDLTHTSLVQAYLDSLSSLGAVPITLLPGAYDYFDVDSLGHIVPPPAYGLPHLQTYALRYEGPHEPLPGVVAAFRDSLYIELHTDLGESFYSHVVVPLDQ